MSEDKFVPSKSIGTTDGPDSPLVEKPVVSGSSQEKIAGAAAPTCTFQGRTYQKGARLCIFGKVMECGNDGWFNTGRNC